MVIVVLINSVDAGLLMHATYIGPWAGSASVEYIEAARDFGAGRGLVLVQASAAGRLVYDEEQLHRAVYDYPQDPDLDRQARREFIELEMTYTDGSAGRRTGEFLAPLAEGVEM